MKLSLKHTAIGFFGMIILLIAISPVLAGEQNRHIVSVDTMLTTPQEKFNGLFLEAVRQQEAGHDSATYGLLQKAIAINPNAAEVYFLLSRYYMNQGQDSLGELNMEKAAALNPDNNTYLEGIAQYAIMNKDYNKAIKKLEQLYSGNHNRTEILGALIQLYQQQNDYPKMLSVINRMETVEGVSKELTLDKMNIYEAMGNTRSAYKTLKSLADENPDDLSYKVMLGNWLMQHNREKEAYKIYTTALKTDPEDPSVQASLYDYYKVKGKDEQANKLLNNIIASPKASSKSKIALLQVAIRENNKLGDDSIKVLNLLNKAMSANPQNGDIAELNALYMTMKKMPQDTINSALRRVLRLSPDKAGIRLQLIQAIWSKQNWDEIISVCAPGIEYNPEQMAFYYFTGIAYYQKNDTDKALNAFKKGVGEINQQSDPSMVSDFYAIMGDLLHQKGLANEAFAAYDSCLQWKPDNMECLNNYAYYLSEEQRDLGKAEQMSVKTIKADPKNSTFLDTYAWILFLQKRYAEAGIYADQAVANNTDSVQNGIVLEHAGDIAYMNNNLPAAMDYWQKAEKTGGGSALLARKIKLKKYVDK